MPTDVTHWSRAAEHLPSSTSAILETWGKLTWRTRTRTLHSTHNVENAENMLFLKEGHNKIQLMHLSYFSLQKCVRHNCSHCMKSIITVIVLRIDPRSVLSVAWYIPLPLHLALNRVMQKYKNIFTKLQELSWGWDPSVNGRFTMQAAPEPRNLQQAILRNVMEAQQKQESERTRAEKRTERVSTKILPFNWIS